MTLSCVIHIFDGSEIYSSDGNGALVSWDSVSGQKLQNFQVSGAVMRTLVVSPDGYKVYSGDANGGLVSWNSMSGLKVQTLQASGSEIRTLTVSPDGSKIYSGEACGAFVSWDNMSGKKVKSSLFLQEKKSLIRRMFFYLD